MSPPTQSGAASPEVLASLTKRLHLGLPVLTGKLERYVSRFDLLEVVPGSKGVPTGARLRAWRKKVGPSFVFSVVLPPDVASLDLAARPSLELAVDSARSLEARVVLLRTPPEVRPTAANRKKLRALFEQLPREPVSCAWEASGMWEPEEHIGLAKELGVLPVLDGTQVPLPSGSMVYTRVRAPVRSVGAPTVLRLARALAFRKESFVVVESAGLAKRLRTELPLAIVREGGDRRPAVRVIRPAQPFLIADDEEQ
jgi:uncharacterized protein YecE (DUF72 family)